MSTDKFYVIVGRIPGDDEDTAQPKQEIPDATRPQQ